MRKIVFLDFDGVLNSHLFMMKENLEGRPVNICGLDPAAVTRLNDLCDRGNALVVISSSWRYGHSLAELRTILSSVGFVGSVIDTTPLPRELLDERLLEIFDVHGASPPEEVLNEAAELQKNARRGVEIDGWLKKHGRDVDGFVVLDDDSDIAPHLDRHVKTSFGLGLQDEHIERALAILAKPRLAQ